MYPECNNSRSEKVEDVKEHVDIEKIHTPITFYTMNKSHEGRLLGLLLHQKIGPTPIKKADIGNLGQGGKFFSQ